MITELVLAGWKEREIMGWKWEEFVNRYQVLSNIKHIDRDYLNQMQFSYSMANDGKNKLPFVEVPFPQKEDKKVIEINKVREKYWEQAPKYTNLQNLLK